MRVVLFTGKGGVGKTTVAAATALRAAERGYRTLVMSTDVAHSLGDVLEKPVGQEVVRIAPHLWAQEVDSLYQLEKYWGTLRRYMVTLFHSRGLEDVVADELANLPGMEEIASLMELRLHVEGGRYDAIVIDCAPTGETMQLLGFPDMARWWLNKIFPIQRRVARLVHPVVQPLVDIPLPTDEVFVAARDLILDVEGIKEILADVARTSIRLVLNPEKMVIKEAQRAFTYFNLFGYATDLIVVNRVLPEGAGAGYFAAWRQAQEQYLRMVDEGFSPVPIRRVPFYERETTGLRMLARVAADLYGDDDPTVRFYTGTPQKIEKRKDEYVLTLHVPFVSKGDVEVFQSDGDLTVRIGTYRRNVALPRTLAGLEARGAKVRDEVLTVTFGRRRSGG
ncbi:MAG: TRC40/GET3/ArsA family transport-energizing ATPase [Armatimonadota bacterium]|nr:TRC40/GET3/ArsA family transport-energizing ATPase [Armatimonadota bacterium]